MRERRWYIYHKFEDEQKKRSLQRLSEVDGFKLLKELFQFACSLNSGLSFKRLNMSKIKVLADIHSTFGRVKA